MSKTRLPGPPGSYRRSESPTRDRRVQLMIAEIKDELAQRITVTALARRVRLSPSRFAHLFRNETGLSVHEYIRRARLQEAKRLLEISFLSVKEIAAQVGLSPDRLSRELRRQLGAPPGKYRLKQSATRNSRL